MKLIVHDMLCFILLVALASAVSETIEMSRETLTEEECKVVVKKVIDKKAYTEDAILPICKETVTSPKCDFFSEALSLASSHPDFSPLVFCKDISEAHFCSQTMDVVLSSPAVADLMLGECMRRAKDGEDQKAKPQSDGMARCLRLQKILSYAIHNDDLDTMRTCYMIQAYGDLEGPKDSKKEEETNETSVPAPSERIITSSGKKIDDLGEGNATEREAVPPKVPPGQAGIVLQPTPLDRLGKGKAAELKEDMPTEANETKNETKAIIIGPLARDGFQSTKVNDTMEAPAQAPVAAPPSPIIVDPIPLKKNESTSALVMGHKRLARKLPTTVALLSKPKPVARHT